jgi:hypothetical protein
VNYATKAYGEVDVYINVFLTLALKGRWSASRPGCFTVGIHRIGGLVSPRTNLDNVEKRAFSSVPGLEIRPLDRAVVASRYTDCDLPERSLNYAVDNKKRPRVRYTRVCYFDADIRNKKDI